MFETLDPVPSEIATAISDGLNAFNESAEIRREAFAIVWRENGGLIAGITASVSFSVLFIGNLWVAKSLRLGGIGTKLMAAAEEEGRRRAAVAACVDTLSTQAPDFYPKLGYVEFGRISGRAGGLSPLTGSGSARNFPPWLDHDRWLWPPPSARAWAEGTHTPRR